MKSNAGHAGQAIERILELSAKAQIARRMTAKDSPAFPQFDRSDRSLWQSTRAFDSIPTAGRVLHNSRRSRLTTRECVVQPLRLFRISQHYCFHRTREKRGMRRRKSLNLVAARQGSARFTFNPKNL